MPFDEMGGFPLLDIELLYFFCSDIVGELASIIDEIDGWILHRSEWDGQLEVQFNLNNLDSWNIAQPPKTLRIQRNIFVLLYGAQKRLSTSRNGFS